MTGYIPPVSGSADWDGPLNDIIAEIDTDMLARPLDDDVVHATGDEVIAGVKSFTDAPVLPADALPISAIDGLQAELDSLGGGLSEAAAVTSVNGETGAVTLTAADVGALSAAATLDDLAEGEDSLIFTPEASEKLDSLPEYFMGSFGFFVHADDSTLPEFPLEGYVAYLSGTGLIHYDGADWLKVSDNTPAF